jgi:hypothetical protein
MTDQPSSGEPVEAYSDPDEFPTGERPDPEKYVVVAFEDTFVDRIDELAAHLAGNPGPGTDEGRRKAVAKAVAVMSRYAGKPLYVEVSGRKQIIEGVWKP